MGRRPVDGIVELLTLVLFVVLAEFLKQLPDEIHRSINIMYDNLL